MLVILTCFVCLFVWKTAVNAAARPGPVQTHSKGIALAQESTAATSVCL
jgi:hypothetical protein